MSKKIGVIANKLIGAGSLVAAMPFLAHVYESFFNPANLLAGLLFAGGGLWLVGRRERAAGPDLETLQQLQRLTDGMAATQAELTTMQERLDQLTEESDFLRQLAARGPGVGPAELARITAGSGLPADPDAALPAPAGEPQA